MTRKKIKNSTWVKAFFIGIIGCLLFKGLEYLMQLVFGWSVLSVSNGGYVLFYQILWAVIWGTLFTFILLMTLRKLWVVSFVPFLYYLAKEIMNMIIVYGGFFVTPILESLIGIPIGFGLYLLVNKFWK